MIWNEWEIIRELQPSWKKQNPFATFCFIKQKKKIHFTPDYGVEWTYKIFVLIKFLVPLNDIKNAKCIWYSRGIYTNVKDFSPKIPNIYIFGFYLRSKSKIVPFYPWLLYITRFFLIFDVHSLTKFTVFLYLQGNFIFSYLKYLTF